MPKATKRPKQGTAPKKHRSLYAIYPWQCRHSTAHSEITAYVEASGTWEMIAEIQPTSGASAETAATYICNILNNHQKNQSLLQDAMDALELCLEEDDLTFASEQAADAVVSRIKRGNT